MRDSQVQHLRHAVAARDRPRATEFSGHRHEARKNIRPSAELRTGKGKGKKGSRALTDPRIRAAILGGEAFLARVYNAYKAMQSRTDPTSGTRRF